LFIGFERHGLSEGGGVEVKADTIKEMAGPLFKKLRQRSYKKAFERVRRTAFRIREYL